jgi:hypothetical protein
MTGDYGSMEGYGYGGVEDGHSKFERRDPEAQPSERRRQQQQQQQQQQEQLLSEGGGRRQASSGALFAVAAVACAGACVLVSSSSSTGSGRAALLLQGHELQRQQRAAAAAGQKREMLAAMNYVERDVADVYNSHDGDVEEKAEMKREGSLRENSDDRRHDFENHIKMDHFIHAGQQHDVGGVGGVGSVAGGGGGAWYSGWWKGMRVSSVLGGVERMTGFRGMKDGKKKLIQAGINVNGWEPGRTRAQIEEDEMDGHSVPKGFWHEDGTPEGEPDTTTIHHPCGSPNRERPCDEEKVEANQLPPNSGEDGIVDAYNSQTGKVEGELWKDPWPMENLVEEAKRQEQQRKDELKKHHEKQLAMNKAAEESGPEGDGADDRVGR